MSFINKMNETKIERGDVYFIQPSEGFAGLEQGKVTIIRIATYEDVKDEYVDPEYLVNDHPELEHAEWIVFKYENADRKDSPFACLDKENFVDHI